MEEKDPLCMKEKIENFIDDTLLTPSATEKQVDDFLEEAKRYEFAAVVVNPYWVSKAKKEMLESSTKVATVIGFPLGANTTAVKVYEANRAILDGADEVDMVLNVGELKGNSSDAVLKDIVSVSEAVHQKEKILKVIIETCLLTEQEKVTAAKLTVEAGVDYLKTSTGFSNAGAELSDIDLLKRVVGDNIKIKAAGGIHSYEQTKKFVSAGVDRIGTSNAVDIVSQAEK